ncbi:MAG: hypothetical protein JXB32_22885 [Deltaproteobacteria bacterium]|nr:hypothetical protein [Deltaproteobacteria bacterium]
MRSLPLLLGCWFIAAACGKNTAPLEELDASTLGAPSEMPGGLPTAGPPDGAWAAGAPPSATTPAWSVSGTVTLAPELADRVPPDAVLFVFARVPGQRVPTAVQRLPGPRFPVEFALEAGHAGEPDDTSPAQLEVRARVSRGGMAGPPQPGDLEGRAPGLVTPGATGVTVTIDAAAGEPGPGAPPELEPPGPAA